VPLKKPLFIKPEIVEKVLIESAQYPITVIDVGESGDAFLNPQALDILRLIRKYSDNTVRMFTNFQTFTPRKIDAVVNERLLDKVIVNIDGASPETYRIVKGLQLERIENHIRYFLKAKEESDSDIELRIQSLTLNKYVRTVKRVLGRDPMHVDSKYLSIPDDFEDIEQKWERWGVAPVKSFVTLWAEDGEGCNGQKLWPLRLKTFYKKYFPAPCRMVPRIKESFFVAPSGEVYLCCADFAFEQIIGDVRTQKVCEIVEGEKRREMIEALQRRNYSKLGGPCLHSELCRAYK
jgi:sulfatase maturation enzyme AslB (radical SAM superfamily)